MALRSAVPPDAPAGRPQIGLRGEHAGSCDRFGDRCQRCCRCNRRRLCRSRVLHVPRNGRASRQPSIHVALAGGGGGSRLSLQLYTTGGSSPACIVVGRVSNQIYTGTYSIAPGTPLTYMASVVGPAPHPGQDAILVLLAEDVSREWWDSLGKRVGPPTAAAKRLREELAGLGLQGFEPTIMPPELVQAANVPKKWRDRFRRGPRDIAR